MNETETTYKVEVGITISGSSLVTIHVPSGVSEDDVKEYVVDRIREMDFDEILLADEVNINLMANSIDGEDCDEDIR